MCVFLNSPALARKKKTEMQKREVIEPDDDRQESNRNQSVPNLYLERFPTKNQPTIKQRLQIGVSRKQVTDAGASSPPHPIPQTGD